MGKWTVVAMAVLAPAFAASAQSADVIWKGDFDNGQASFSGNCTAGQDQWCNDQIARPAQVQAVASPAEQGKFAGRFEVKFGDVYKTYSDSRALITGPSTLWEDEGSERWYRWQAMWPMDWVGRFPKWDELSNPNATSHGGSIVEWHHDANGGVESGSAPLYIGGDDKYIWLCLVDQATSTCREYYNLTPLIRGHWHDIVLHAKWSSNASVGFVEMFIDGVNVLPKHFTSNKYPGMRNYMIVGLYRNGEIGDPKLVYPNGTHVYGNDGAPGVVYLDGFIIGKTQAAVMSEALLSDVPPPGVDAGTPVADADAGTGAGAGGSAPDAGNIASQPSGAATATVAAASAAGSGCSSGGLPVVWTALLGLTILGLRTRRKRHAPSA
jgi:hypothetical protein